MERSTKQKTVFMYCRKSSEGEDRQVLSIPSQSKELRQIAERLNLKIIDVFEEAQSAKAPGRPKFGEMMGRLYKKEVDGILCWKLDRLARNAVDGGSIIWAVKDRKVEVITHSQTYSSENENTLLMYVEFGMAQKFIDDLGKNSQRGMKSKADLGWYPAHAPLGYKNTPDKKKGFKVLIKDEERFPLVRRLFDEVLSGKQASQVYEEASNIWRLTSQNGTILARSTFYNILNNPFYYGKYEWPNGSGNWFHGLHECVITKEEFDVVQRMLGKLGKPIAHNHSFYLTGLFRCKECGCAITATKKIKHYQETSRTVTYTYYHCTRKNKAIKCNFKPLTEENLFRDINEFLLTVKPDIEFIKWAKKWLAIVHKDQSENQETVLKSQQRALEDTERRLNKLLDMRLNDMLDDSAYKIKKSQLEKEKRDISEMLANVEKGLDAWRVKVENTLDFAYACQQKFASGTRDDKHEIMMRLCSNLCITNHKTLDITLKREYLPLADQDNWDERYKDWLEPVKYTEMMAKNPDLRPANPLWLPRVDSNHEP